MGRRGMLPVGQERDRVGPVPGAWVLGLVSAYHFVDGGLGLPSLASAGLPKRGTDEDLPVGITRLTINEIRRLWNRVVMRTTHTVDHTMKWSEWRFQARQRARNSHYRRRERHNLSLQY